MIFAFARGHSSALMKAALALLATFAMQASNALDWRNPSTEPQDAAAAATSSDEYAWRLFVALNWPADLRLRAADRLARFGGERRVVWETWQSVGDVYKKNGVDPGPWIVGSVARPVPPERRFEIFSPKDLPNARHIVDGVMVSFRDSRMARWMAS